ncbi:hypothetical protein VNO78_19042 [Psophocarpus tetragonolobus]|uniref:Uncharacterized protein n=1 Tax=Psophocarpus tetragonolobus TaxID=3891 RepID=A0AAN9SBJ5_PSOTE
MADQYVEEFNRALEQIKCLTPQLDLSSTGPFDEVVDGVIIRAGERMRLGGTMIFTDRRLLTKEQSPPKKFDHNLLLHDENRTRFEMVERLNLEPRLELKQALQNDIIDLQHESAIGRFDLDEVGRDEFLENKNDTVGRDVLERLA